MSHTALPHLSLAILTALLDGPHHGYAIMKAVKEQSEGALNPGTGSLYVALDRLVGAGLIDEDAAIQVKGRRRRTFSINDAGRDAVRTEATRLAKLIAVAEKAGQGPLPAS